jgi:hypothetical protein
MNWLMYLSWVAGPALEITLLAFMIHRKLHTEFPRFFSYILFQIVKSAALFATYRYYPDVYFEAYWTGNAVSVILAVVVMDEILHKLFKEYGGAQNLGAVIFRWTCGLLLILAIVNALSSQQGSSDRVVATVLSFDRSVRLMQCGLVCLLLILCRFLKHCWQQRVFGIALGFGIFSSIELILVSAAMHYGSSSGEIVSLVKSAAYNGVTLLWIFYLKQQEEAIPEMQLAPALGVPMAALADSTPGGTRDPFISMVENAVEQVLSRNPWPRPAIDRSRVVGRQPGPKESN